MAKLIAQRSSQKVMCSEFTFNFDDTMDDINGAVVDFAAVGTKVVEPINLPPKAIIVGGEVVTETAVTGPAAYNISVGDSGAAARYLAPTNRGAAGITALVPTGYVGDGENLRVTVAATTNPATTGKVTVRIRYIQRDRENEVVPS